MESSFFTKKSPMKNLFNLKGPSRRKFLQQLAAWGTGSVLAGGAIASALYYEHKKKNTERIKEIAEHTKELQINKNALSELQRRGREGLPGKRWIWVIDLAKCKNARRCMTACQQAHHLRPEQSHMNVIVMKSSEHTPAYYMPKPCQHCDNPPCVSVCPVDATFKRQDGPVLIDNERCIGCRFCIAACPYNARMFNWIEPLYAKQDEGMPYNVELNLPQKKGTITKCVMSADRLREGKLPYCVSACPNGVYWFGDENEDVITNGTTHETLRLSEFLEKNGAFQLLPELGTKPRVYYLPPKDRTVPVQPKDKEIANEYLHHIDI